MTAPKFTRLRWRLWGFLSDRPGNCPPNTLARVIYGHRDRDMRIDSVCRSDLAANKTCYCGKLRLP